jgi:protein-disulfide isomerase
MKKVWSTLGIILGIVAVLAVLVLIAKMQDAPAQTSKNVAEVTALDHVTGKLDSAVTLIEYSDFQCPACGAYAPVVERLISEYGDRVRFVYRHFPIYSKHPNAEIAGRAAEAAGQQGKFFEYGAILFAKQNDWAELSNPQDTFIEYAKSLSLNTDDFKAYMLSSDSKKTVSNDYRSGVQAGVSGTPTFFLNGEALENPQGYTAFKKILDDALAASASATPETSAPSPSPVVAD